MLAVPHRVFVDAVIDHLFEEDVDAIIRTAAITQFADIHTGPQADMFLPVEAPYRVLIIPYFFLSHIVYTCFPDRIVDVPGGSAGISFSGVAC
jgi:hypothetical protein